jgi:hypothetical protein
MNGWFLTPTAILRSPARPVFLHPKDWPPSTWAQCQCSPSRAACAEGRHDWHAEGGRPCPFVAQEVCPIDLAICSRLGTPSQAVYRCRACGVYDYGTKLGGPGWVDCGQCMRDL